MSMNMLFELDRVTTQHLGVVGSGAGHKQEDDREQDRGGCKVQRALDRIHRDLLGEVRLGAARDQKGPGKVRDPAEERDCGKSGELRGDQCGPGRPLGSGHQQCPAHGAHKDTDVDRQHGQQELNERES